MLIIDRFEGDWAVIEFGRKTFNLPRALLPEGAKEGDVIRIGVTLDPAATRERRASARQLAEELFED